MATDLKTTTNRLASLAKLNQDAINPRVVGGVLSDACQALTDIMEDLRPSGRLARGLQLLGLRRAATDKEYIQILEGTELFVDVFIRPEAVALLQAGLTLEATTALIGDARQLRGLLLNGRRDHDEILARIPDFRDEICCLAEALRGALEMDGESRNWIGRALMVVGGGVIIGVNAGIDTAATAGLLPVVTAISGDLGARLIDAGVGS